MATRSDPQAESKERRSSRCFSCFSCFSMEKKSSRCFSCCSCFSMEKKSSRCFSCCSCFSMEKKSSRCFSCCSCFSMEKKSSRCFSCCSCFSMEKKSSRCSSCFPCFSARAPSFPEVPILNDEQDGDNSSSNTVVYTDHLRAHVSRPTDALSVPSAFEPNASPTAADDKFPGGDSHQASNAAPLVYHHDEQVGLPIDAPSLPSTSEPCPPPAPVAHHHDEQVGLPMDDPSVPSTFVPNASPPAPVAHHHDEQVRLPIDAPSLPSTSESCPPPAPVAHHDEQVRLPIDALSVPSTCQATAPPTAADDKVLEGVSPQASAAGNLDEQVGLPSASSSSETVANIINAIHEEAEKSDLHAIIQRISELFDAIKLQKESQKKTERLKELQKNTKRSKGSQKKTFWGISARFVKLKDFLLEAVNSICSLKDILPDKFAHDVVQGLGQAHWVTSGLLLIVYFLDRFETLSSNQERCLSLLEEMYHLALDVQKLEGWKGLLKAERDGLAKDGAELIVKGSLICSNQMSRIPRSSFLSTSVDQDDLLHFKGKFDDFNHRMLRRMSTWICSSLFCRTARPLRPRENAYPDHAVGIEEPFNHVTKLLQWESEERAFMVIVHGFGGIGKSTLADAVFARYYVKGCKYSVVRLDSSRDIGNSEIVELQKKILKDLRGTEDGRTSEGTEGDENILDFDDFQDGRRKIGDLLKKEVAFLFIDNVVDSGSFEKLLPPTTKLKDARKMRLLITARDINVLNPCNIKRGVHMMQELSPDQGKELLSKEMCNGPDDINMQITGSDVDKIVEISGGVPKLLELMIRFILSEPDKIRESYKRVIEDSEKFTGGAFSDIDRYIFAYDGLPHECKNPFLDICYFFKGWEWETVANIVGGSELNQLERRALVSKDKDMISLHDVILTMGKQKAQDPGVDFYTRYDFSNANTFQIQHFFKKDTEYLKLVKGLWFGDQECKIPVDSLDPMHNSLRIFGHKMVLEEGQCGKTFDNLLVYKGETPQLLFKWSGLENIRFLSYRPQNLALLQEIPSRNLKHIELDGSLCSEREILSSHIQQLEVLQVLRLINFHNLEKLPEEWGKYLTKNLKELTLSHCTAMKQLTGSISQLTSLRILKLDNCCNLSLWPEHCESLRSSLQKLNMWNCGKLKWLPTCFAEALDSDSRRLFKHKGILLDSPQSDSDSDYESDED